MHPVRIEVQDVRGARRTDELVRVVEGLLRPGELHEERLRGLRREPDLQDDAGDDPELALRPEVQREVRVALVDPLHPASRGDDLEGLDVLREMAELQAVDPVAAGRDPAADGREPGTRVRPEREALPPQDLLQGGPPDARLDGREVPLPVD